jgi:hypothetical protein
MGGNIGKTTDISTLCVTYRNHVMKESGIEKQRRLTLVMKDPKKCQCQKEAQLWE